MDAEKHFKDLVEKECVSTDARGTRMEEFASTSSPTATPHSSGTSIAAPDHSAVASNSTVFARTPLSVQDVMDSCRKLLEPLECKEKLTVLSMLFITISGISLPSWLD